MKPSTQLRQLERELATGSVFPALQLKEEFNKIITKVQALERSKNKDKEKAGNMASCMLSILDYLKLQDVNGDMTELNDETLSGMMFRKMNSMNIDLNKELGFTHLKPITKQL